MSLCQALLLLFPLPVCYWYCRCYSPCCCCCCSSYCALQFSHVDKLVSPLNSCSALHLHSTCPPAAVMLTVVCLIIGIVVVHPSSLPGQICFLANAFNWQKRLPSQLQVVLHNLPAQVGSCYSPPPSLLLSFSPSISRSHIALSSLCCLPSPVA